MIANPIEAIQNKVRIRVSRIINVESIGSFVRVSARLPPSFSVRAGDHFAVDAGGKWRRFTVARQVHDTVELVVDVGHDGPASRWFRHVQPGDELRTRSHERGWGYFPAAVGVCDGSGLATMIAAGPTRLGVLGVEPEVLALLGVDGTVLQTPQRAQLRINGNDTVLAAGEVGLVNSIRTLSVEAGVPRSQRFVRGYWKPGRVGME